jgi:hypothetical protein
VTDPFACSRAKSECRQRFNIGEILGSGCSFLIGQEGFQTNEGKGRTRGDPDLNPRLPSIVKRYPVNRPHQIKPVRGASKLNDHPRLKQLVCRTKARDIPRPKFDKRFKKCAGVRHRRTIKNVHITGEARMTVENYRFPTDNDKLNPVLFKYPEEFADIGAEDLCRSCHRRRTIWTVRVCLTSGQSNP